jgi:oxygen-independent coproporphyrinogen-3 oxidase
MATPDKLDALLENGFSRFSLGVQDMHPDVQKAVYRNQELLSVQEVVAHLRDRGIDEINFDLIYGLPAQTMETAQFTLDEVRKLRPNRIALYSYAHVPWIMKHQTALEKTGLPNPDEKIDLYLFMARGLIEAGYLPIGMDHFALPDDNLVEAMNQGTLRRTFMGYTTGKGLDTLGLGVSAISWVGDSYAQNYKDILSWRQAVESGEMPWERGFLLSEEDLLRREVITQISCNLMVDLESLDELFSLDVPTVLEDSISRLKVLEGDGLIETDQDKIFVTERGRLFTRNICMVFDHYLEKDGNQARYSRTV